jgi:hypothetical protein
MSLTANQLRFVTATTATSLAGLLLLMFLGCTSKPTPSSTEESNTQQAPPASAVNNFDGGTYCLEKFIAGPVPAQPLHFSNKVTESDPSLKSKDFEADLSGDNLDIVHIDRWLATDQDRQFFAESQKFTDPKVITRKITNGVAEETVTNHLTRSDASGWSMGSTTLAQGGTPWSLFLSKPTVNRVGPDKVNGYDTVKYAVDTTHDRQMDKASMLATTGLKDYNIIGTAWVLKDADCVLQYDITYEQDGKDGKVSKTHYEGTITKK